MSEEKGSKGRKTGTGKLFSREGEKEKKPMRLKERYTNLLDSASDAMARFEINTDSQAVKVATAVAVGIGISAFAGVAVAAAVGGFVLFHERGVLRSVFDGKASRPKPLSPDQWRNAFEPEHGRLKGGGEKVIGRVRKGGCDPNVRGEVWPFLLGLYDGNSTQAERDMHRLERRRRYEDLRHRCKSVGVKAQREEDERSRIQRRQEEASIEARRVQKEMEEGRLGHKRAALRESPPSDQTDSNGDGLAAEEEPLLGTLSEGATGEEKHSGEYRILKPEEAAQVQEDLADAGNDGNAGDGNARMESGENPEESQFLADFATWRRIMRLDAVRMNAAWIPYSSQEPTSQEEAEALAADVGLIDDAHLEPSRRHHAARLVAILEAYALFDPEIGYCQGMSDLLSPFAALIDDDSDAFWCFVSFMTKARQNFRVDEIGIRKQLESVSFILKTGDPQLYRHLQQTQTEDCIFVYRMIVVLLRRELSFEQTLALWEVVWADAAASAAVDAASSAASAAGASLIRTKSSSRVGPTSDLLLFVVAAIIQQHRDQILACESVDEILRLCNSFAGKLDVWSLVDGARSLVATVGTSV